eukprot:7388561-Prymnesium_polylepis.1
MLAKKSQKGLPPQQPGTDPGLSVCVVGLPQASGRPARGNHTHVRIPVAMQYLKMLMNLLRRENEAVGGQDGGHAWPMINDILANGALHPCTDPIPDAFPVAWRTKLPHHSKAATCNGAPRLELLRQLAQEVQRLAVLEVGRRII